MFPALISWAVPFFLIPIAYLFYRFLPLRKVRYIGYAILLIAAFFLDLFRLSFHKDIFDTVLRLGVTFILAEFFWNLLRLKKMKLFSVLAVIALGLFALEFKQWMAGGPAHGRELWSEKVASTYRTETAFYYLKDREIFEPGHPGRELILSRQVGSSPFERKISRYPTPKGFKETDFLYAWSTTPQGVRLDLHVPGFDRQIWTMGEGF
jgi:hypothetical protein